MNEKKNRQEARLSGGRNVRLYLGKLLGIALTTVPFYIGWRMADAASFGVVALYVLLYALFANLYDAYALPYFRTSELVYSQSLSAALTDVVLLCVTALLAHSYVSILSTFLVLAAQVALCALWSFVARKLYASSPSLRLLAVEGDPGRGAFVDDLLKAETRFRLAATVSVGDYLADPERYLTDADAVCLAGVHGQDRNQILKDCTRRGVPVYFMPKVSDYLTGAARRVPSFYRPIARAEGYSPSMTYLIVKRVMDIALSLAALVLLSPLMIVVGILIRRDGGPVFYRQERLTTHGKAFQILKFRSMAVDAESDGAARLSAGGEDSRVTRVGNFIRRYRIDELPQLLNILRGDMSIVGPRPERPELAEQYEKELPEFAFRLQAKAGLTGYAQVRGKYNTTPYDKLLMDLRYISRPSLWEDVKIILATIKILFVAESTDGVKADDAEEPVETAEAEPVKEPDETEAEDDLFL